MDPAASPDADVRATLERLGAVLAEHTELLARQADLLVEIRDKL
jgi:hypothetical protein